MSSSVVLRPDPPAGPAFFQPVKAADPHGPAMFGGPAEVTAASGEDAFYPKKRSRSVEDAEQQQQRPLTAEDVTEAEKTRAEQQQEGMHRDQQQYQPVRIHGFEKALNLYLVLLL